MMPLMLADVGEEVSIHKIGGGAQIKKHLENLGFVPGERIKIVSVTAGNLIVVVKETRVALSRVLAQKILVA